jgi:hypothetical protein
MTAAPITSVRRFAPLGLFGRDLSVPVRAGQQQQDTDNCDGQYDPNKPLRNESANASSVWAAMVVTHGAEYEPEASIRPDHGK